VFVQSCHRRINGGGQHLQILTEIKGSQGKKKRKKKKSNFGISSLMDCNDET